MLDFMLVPAYYSRGRSIRNAVDVAVSEIFSLGFTAFEMLDWHADYLRPLARGRRRRVRPRDEWEPKECGTCSVDELSEGASSLR